VILKKIFLIVLGSLFALVAVEIGLRVLGFGVVTPQMSFGMHARIALDQGYFLPDPTLFWKVRPDLNPEFDREANILSPDRAIPPHGERKRVLILGDSCSRIAGDGMPYSVTLEADLGPDRWEVLNASVPGYTSYQGLAWLRSQLLDAKPDVVVVYFGWNEHWRTTGMTDREYARSREVWYPRVFTLLRGRHHPPPFRVSKEEYRENIGDIVRLVGKRGGRVILIAGPYRFAPGVQAQYVKDHYLVESDEVESLHRAYLDVVRGFAGHGGVAVVAADSVFQALGEATPLLREDGIHFTAPGHAAMAAILTEYLRPEHETESPPFPAVVAAARRAVEGS
jgi:lysophospholipase L1-like esterase